MEEDDFRKELDQFNKDVASAMLLEWCSNINENSATIPECKNIGELPSVKSKYATIIAASPDLDMEDVAKLNVADTDILLVNKIFRRYYEEIGRAPSYVFCLDHRAMSIADFRWLGELEDGPLSQIRRFTKFILSTTVHPQTLVFLKNRDMDVYLFNPIDLSKSGDYRVSQIWQMMNGMEEMEHGGNVGALALNFAKWRYSAMALMGFGMYEELEEIKTMEEARERFYLWYPEEQRVLAFPLHFKIYYAYICNVVNDLKNNGKVIFNLNKAPHWKHYEAFMQGTVYDWVWFTRGALDG